MQVHNKHIFALRLRQLLDLLRNTRKNGFEILNRVSKTLNTKSSKSLNMRAKFSERVLRGNVRRSITEVWGRRELLETESLVQFLVQDHRVHVRLANVVGQNRENDVGCRQIVALQEQQKTGFTGGLFEVKGDVRAGGYKEVVMVTEAEVCEQRECYKGGQMHFSVWVEGH